MLQNTSILQGLTVSGNTSLSNTVITGTTDINRTGSATTTIGNSGSATNVSGTFNVVGVTNINTVGSGTTIIGSSNSATTALNSVATTVGGTLGVTGLTTLSGGIKTNSLTSIATNGAMTIAGDQTSGGTVTIGTSSTATTLNGTTTASLSTTSVAVTQTTGTSGTAIATTAFVANTAALKANIASPTFTGTVTIPAGASIAGYAPTASPTFTGTLGVTGSTTLSGGATVTGNVGIGTTTPGHTLDVSGSIRVTGDATIPKLITTTSAFNCPLINENGTAGTQTANVRYTPINSNSAYVNIEFNNITEFFRGIIINTTQFPLLAGLSNIPVFTIPIYSVRGMNVSTVTGGLSYVPSNIFLANRSPQDGWFAQQLSGSTTMITLHTSAYPNNSDGAATFSATRVDTLYASGIIGV